MTHAGLRRYTIDQLISWRKHALPLDQVVCRRVRVAFSRRGCRAGRKKHRTVSSDVDTGHIPVISVVRPATPPPPPSSRSPRHITDHQLYRSPSSVSSRPVAGTVRQQVLTTVPRQRHDITSNRCTQFGCLNIRSLNNKLDDVLEVTLDQCIDVLFLVETWHDQDAVCVRRLRADGF